MCHSSQESLVFVEFWPPAAPNAPKFEYVRIFSNFGEKFKRVFDLKWYSSGTQVVSYCPLHHLGHIFKSYQYHIQSKVKTAYHVCNLLIEI